MTYCEVRGRGIFMKSGIQNKIIVSLDFILNFSWFALSLHDASRTRKCVRAWVDRIKSSTGGWGGAFSFLFASFLSPYEKNRSNRELSYSPPVKIYTITPDNKLSKPYFYNLKREFNPHTLSTTYHEIRNKKHYINFFTKGYEYKLFGLFKTNIHLIGTDKDG